MSNRTIEQLPPIPHEDVDPMYSKDEILNILATSVHYIRESAKGKYGINGEQAIVVELIYSLAKAFLK